MHRTTVRLDFGIYQSTLFGSSMNCEFATLWQHSNAHILFHGAFCARVHKSMQDLTEIWDLSVKRFGIWAFLTIWDWDLTWRFEIWCLKIWDLACKIWFEICPSLVPSALETFATIALYKLTYTIPYHRCTICRQWLTSDQRQNCLAIHYTGGSLVQQ